MSKPKLLNTSTILAFVFVFSMTALDVILSFMGWKPTFGDDLLAGIIGFLPSVGSVALSMLIGVTHSWKTKVLSSIIWLFCITISLTGNFLNMTARAFESLDAENQVKVEVSNVKDSNKIQIDEYKKANQERIDSLKASNKEQLVIFDQEIAELTIQYNTARESRDFQINDGVNRDGSMGPKARAFQAAMDRLSEEIESKRVEKRKFQRESTNELLDLQNTLAQSLLQFQAKSSDKVSEANVELAKTQNDMRGHMPVIRYFIPSKEGQRQAVLWGLGLFAAVISLAGPIVSYAMAVHLNHKRLAGSMPPKPKRKEEEPVLVEEEEPVEEGVIEEPVEEDVVEEEEQGTELEVADDNLAKDGAIEKASKGEQTRLQNLGYR